MGNTLNTIIRLKNVTKTYQMGQSTVEALRDVDLELAQGTFYSIVGPSGSGKSSLLHIIGCMDIPTSGELWIGEKYISQLEEKALTRVRAQHIGFIFQAFHLNPILTARENVAIARALVKAPQLVLADEPTGNLDSQRGHEIIDLLRQIKQQEHTTIIQVTHDPEVARMSDCIITLRDGQVVGQRNT